MKQMKKTWLILLLLLMMCLLWGLAGFEKVTFSENILFGINQGAAGFGTKYDVMDADITVFCDGTVHVDMKEKNDSGYPCRVATFDLSEEDLDALMKVVDRKKLYHSKVSEDMEACDGSSSYIALYDENDEVLVKKGGYMAKGRVYTKMYRQIKEILKPYDIESYVQDYRDELEDYDVVKEHFNYKTWKTEDGRDSISFDMTRYEIDGVAYNKHWMTVTEDDMVIRRVEVFDYEFELEHYMSPPEEVYDNEVLIAVKGIKGEMSYDAVIVMDLEHTYIRYLNSDREWAYYYLEEE